MSAILNDVRFQRAMLSGQDRGAKSEAAFASMLLHGLVLGGLVLVAVKRPVAPPVPRGDFAVVFAPPPPAPPVSLSEASVRAVPDQMPVSATLTAPAAISYAPPRPRNAMVRATPHAAAPAAPRAVAQAAAPATVAARPAPPDTSAARAALEAQISRAVNEAKFYPPAARQMHRQGRAEISFSYLDGAVAQVALAQSSHVAMLDNAALEAVRRARYPRPFAGLAGQTLHVSVWLDFSLVGTD
jgi:TonB family protein